jgi:hypothetical protein
MHSCITISYEEATTSMDPLRNAVSVTNVVTFKYSETPGDGLYNRNM